MASRFFASVISFSSPIVAYVTHLSSKMIKKPFGMFKKPTSPYVEKDKKYLSQ